MNVLIFGAAGRTGRLLVKHAIVQHHIVTAFVRSPADFGMAAANLAVFTGNVTDPGAIGRAMKNQDVVFCVLGNSRPRQPDPSVVQGVRSIVQSMQERGVRRLIYQSCLGVAESRSASGLFSRLVGSRVRRYELADHESKEGLIRASGLDWTIVRPGKLTAGERTGVYRVGEGIRPAGLGWQPSISCADTAECLVRLSTDPAAVRKTLNLMR